VVKNLLLTLTVKELQKFVSIRQTYGQEYGGSFVNLLTNSLGF